MTKVVDIFIDQLRDVFLQRIFELDAVFDIVVGKCSQYRSSGPPGLARLMPKRISLRFLMRTGATVSTAMATASCAVTAALTLHSAPRRASAIMANGSLSTRSHTPGVRTWRINSMFFGARPSGLSARSVSQKPWISSQSASLTGRQRVQRDAGADKIFAQMTVADSSAALEGP